MRPAVSDKAAATITAMTWWQWLLSAAGVTLAIYAAFVAALIIAGRRQDGPLRDISREGAWQLGVTVPLLVLSLA